MELHLLTMQGKDRIEFSQRLVSADIKTLEPGKGLGSCLLTAEGKLRSFFWLCSEPEKLLFIGEKSSLEELEKAFLTYQFNEQIEMKWDDQLRLSITSQPAETPPPVSKKNESWLIHWKESELCISTADAPCADSKSLRLKHLIPSFSEELCKGRLVFELGFEVFCADNKGCYIGQEVVERVRSRGGQASQLLSRLSFEAPPQAEESILSKSDGSVAGQLTRTISSTEALAYIKRKHLKTGEQFLGESSQALLTLEA